MSETVEVKTCELEGPALDWAVAKASRLELTSIKFGSGVWVKGLLPPGIMPNATRWEPSNNWAQAGPLIEKFHIQTSYNGNGFSRSPTREYWCAYVCEDSGQELRPSGGGPTAIIAACRAIVTASLGETVSVPAELIK
ncbi:phage protein NinX family protein [Pseudomonas aeruginosa]